MVKSLSLNAQSAASTDEHLEPVVQVFLNWGFGLRYATKEIGIWVGRILSFSGVTSQRRRNNASDVTSVSITLDDSDGQIYDYVKSTDIEKTEAIVYQYFDGESGSSSTEIFRGVVVTPVVWSEGNRTVKITIESHIESGKVGYSIESGEFGVNNEIAVGKMWPIVYGKPAHVPAILAQRQPNSVLQYSLNMGAAMGEEELYEFVDENVDGINFKNLRIKDNSDVRTFQDGASLRFGKLYVEDASGFSQGEDNEIELIINGVIFKGFFNNDTEFTITEPNAPKYEDLAIDTRPKTDPDSDSLYVFWLKDDVSIVNHYIIVEIGSKTVKRYVYYQENKKCWVKEAFYTIEKGIVYLTPLHSIKEVRALDNGLDIRLQEFVDGVKDIYKRRAIRNEEGSANPYALLIKKLKLIKFIRDAFWSAKEGARVRQWNGPNEIYVANAVPSDSVTSVYGVRNVEGEKHFVPIPKDYYTIHLSKSTNINSGEGPQTVTTIEFQNPLYSFKDQNWEDDIYVTVNSTLSNNPARIIQNLLSSYTNLTTDSTTFDSVASDLSVYPANFALLEEWEAIKLIESIAWQARCALIYDSEDVKIKYLSKEPSSDFTLDESNAEFQSLETGSTDQVEVVTELKGIYHRTYKPEIDPSNSHRRIDRWQDNASTYGERQREVEIFIFNHADLVNQTIKFWGNRLANVWRIVTIRCFHDAMKLEPFDTVTLSFSDLSLVGSSNIKTVVRRVRNLVMDGVVELELWMPITVGNSTTNDLAWLDDIDSAPANIADTYKQIDYNIQDSNVRWSIDEAIEHLKEVRRKTTRSAKVKSIE